MAPGPGAGFKPCATLRLQHGLMLPKVEFLRDFSIFSNGTNSVELLQILILLFAVLLFSFPAFDRHMPISSDSKSSLAP